MQVVKDGEGITQAHGPSIVEGAESDEAARRIGLAIGNSPLVKTAIAGEDANWGRIVAAVGKSGEAANRDRLFDLRSATPGGQGRHAQSRLPGGAGRPPI